MTHQGRRVTLITALPTLLRITSDPSKRNMTRRLLGCRGAERYHAPAAGVSEIPDLQWSHCPFDLVESPLVLAALSLYELAQVSPLHGWPDRYAAWAVHGVMSIRRARQ